MSDHSKRPAGLVVVAVGAAVAKVLPADERRRSLVIGATTVGPVYLSPYADLADGRGIMVPTSGSPVKLCCCDLGSLITREWYAICPAGAATIAIAVSEAGPGEE